MKNLNINTDEVSHICLTCKYARKLCITNDLLCPKCGMVTNRFSCNSYSLNRLIKRPPKKHSIDTSRFSKDTFSI